MKTPTKPRAILLAGILLILVCSCGNNTTKSQTQEPAPVSADESPSQSSVYLQEYSGAYTIEVRGYSSSTDAEALALGPNGQCTWIWLRKTASGTMATQKKYGHWTAREGFIHTVVKGQTGDLEEDFTLVNGVFRNGDRYLKKTGN